MGEIDKGNSEKLEPSTAALFVEGYYFVLYCFDHPDEERRANALIADADYESSHPVKPWSDKNKRERLTSILRSVVLSAARELESGEYTDARLQEYCLEKWEEGKVLAQDLINDEPNLDNLVCPLEDKSTFQKVCDQLQGKPRRSLSMELLISKNLSQS